MFFVASNTKCQTDDNSWMERIKNMATKVAFLSVIGFVGYWMVKLFDLKLSTKHIITTKISMSTIY